MDVDAATVLKFIRDTPSFYGVTAKDIADGGLGITPSRAVEILDFLSSELRVYKTIDAFHFRAAPPARDMV